MLHHKVVSCSSLKSVFATLQDTLYVAVKYCSKLFSYGLPGAGVLMADCITACSTVLAATGRPSDVRERVGGVEDSAGVLARKHLKKGGHLPHIHSISWACVTHILLSM